jgi:hypothetical protein
MVSTATATATATTTTLLSPPHTTATGGEGRGESNVPYIRGEFLNIENGGGDVGIHRLHRDYLHGLDDDIVRSLPFDPPQASKVERLLQQRSIVYQASTKGMTISVYMLLLSIIVLAVLIPKSIATSNRTLGLSAMVLLIVDGVLILSITGVYCWYVYIDRQIQTHVRQIMDEHGIGADGNRPLLSRNDSAQLGYFDLPEFISLAWQRASLASSVTKGGDDDDDDDGHNNNNKNINNNNNINIPNNYPSQQFSTLTFG